MMASANTLFGPGQAKALRETKTQDFLLSFVALVFGALCLSLAPLVFDNFSILIFMFNIYIVF